MVLLSFRQRIISAGTSGLCMGIYRAYQVVELLHKLLHGCSSLVHIRLRSKAYLLGAVKLVGTIRLGYRISGSIQLYAELSAGSNFHTVNVKGVAGRSNGFIDAVAVVKNHFRIGTVVYLSATAGSCAKELILNVVGIVCISQSNASSGTGFAVNQHKTSGTFHITGFYSRVGIIDFLQHILHGAVCSNSLDFLTVNLELGKSLIQACFVSYIIGKSQLVQIIHDRTAGGNLVGSILANLQVRSYLSIGGAYGDGILSVGTVKSDTSCGRVHYNLSCTESIVKILLNSILYRI